MNTLPDSTTLYYILIFVFLASFTTLTLILLYSFYTWLSSRKKNIIYKQLYEVDPRDDAYKDALKIIEKARQKSMSLLKDAQIEKQQVTESTNKLEHEIKTMFETKARQLGKYQQKKLEAMSQDFIDKYDKTLSEETTVTKESLDNISLSIKEDLLKEVKEFYDSLKQSTYESQKEINNKLSTDYANAKREVENYKRHAIEQIGKTVDSNVRQLTKDVLGKTMTQNDQEEFIKSSLEKILSSSEFNNL